MSKIFTKLHLFALSFCKRKFILLKLLVVASILVYLSLLCLQFQKFIKVEVFFLLSKLRRFQSSVRMAETLSK